MFHDGDCPLCAVEVAHYKKIDLDGALAFCDATKEDRALESAGLTRDQALGRLHVRRPDGSLASGARAFVEIWRRLPGWRRIAPVAALPPFIWVLEAGYRVTLIVRPWLAERISRRRAESK